MRRTSIYKMGMAASPPRARDGSAARRPAPARAGPAGKSRAAGSAPRSATRPASRRAYAIRSTSATAWVSWCQVAVSASSCLAAGAGQLVELGPPVVVGRPPPRGDPAAPLQPVQGGVQRALRHLQRGARDLVEALRDGPAVLRPERQRLEDQQIECALREVEPLVRHVCPLSLLQETIREPL